MFQKFSDAMRRQLESKGADSEAPVPSADEGAEEHPMAAVAVAEVIAGAEAVIAGAAPAAAYQAPDVLDVGAIGAAAAGRAAGRLLGRPGFWIVVAVLAVLLLFWLL